MTSPIIPIAKAQPAPIHPFWSVGFRPFFALACLSGLALPALWLLFYTGALPAPAASFTAVQWHAHEMFFGFGWALLGGFLLTASRNWVGSDGYSGRALMLLAAAWLLDRIAMGFGGDWPRPVFLLANQLFLVAIVVMVLATLLRHRARDSYADNYFFLFALPIFPLAKVLMLGTETFPLGIAMTIALFRVAFLVMLERTLTTFMKGVFQIDLVRKRALDLPIKALACVLVGAAVMPPKLAALLELLLAVLLMARFSLWQPQVALRRIDVGIMYLGYLAIVAHLLLDALDVFARPGWIGTVTVHVFTFGAIGLIAPAMITRISKGHTGRKVVFDGIDKAMLWLMLAALLLRIVAPQLHPGGYLVWISLAAAGWSVCFGVLGWRYIPLLMQPRADGKAG